MISILRYPLVLHGAVGVVLIAGFVFGGSIVGPAWPIVAVSAWCYVAWRLVSGRAALRRAALDVFRRLVEASPDLPDELAGAVESVTDPRHLVYFVASVVPLDAAARQELLEMEGIPVKLRRVVDALQRELAVRELGKKIMNKELSLADLSDRVLSNAIEPRPKSGRQEMLENLVNRYV